MDHPVRQVLQCELLRGRSDVALLVPVPLHHVIDRSHQHVASDVELALAVQEWHDVALDYVSASTAVRPQRFGFDDVADAFDSVADVDPTSSIGVFSRLNDPHVLLFLPLVLWYFLDLGVVRWLKAWAVASVRFKLFSSVVVVANEVHPLLVSLVLDMKGHWNVLKRILLKGLIVGFEIEVQSLFIREVPIELQVVVGSDCIRWRELPQRLIRRNLHRIVVTRVL